MFLTTLHHTDDVLRGLAMGAVDFIIKPVSAVRLAKKISDHFNCAEISFAMA
jgi:DNA-binding response OmpR family regulator